MELTCFYLVYFHCCCIRVCRKVRLLQIESPIGRENIFFPNFFTPDGNLQILFFPPSDSCVKAESSTAIHFIEYAFSTLHVTSFIDDASSFHCNGGIIGNHDYVIGLFLSLRSRFNNGHNWHNIYKGKSFWRLLEGCRRCQVKSFYLIYLAAWPC